MKTHEYGVGATDVESLEADEVADAAATELA
jgi:hypothetical protein